MQVESHRIEPCLERILASAEFARSERMARFLSFIVRRSISVNGGRIATGNEIKERTIGIEVFDRPPDWDPKLDTIVRSEARRLRKKLEIYYQTAGSSDPVRISIPKGGYVPEFEIVREFEAPPASGAARSPVSGNRRLALTATALAVALCASLGAFMWKSHDPGASDSFVETPFANAYGQEFTPAVSPDGKFIAYVWDGDADNFDIYVKAAEGGTPVRFTSGPEPDLNPAWSPDGKSIAFLRCGNGHCDVVIRSWPAGSERVAGRIRADMGNWTDTATPLLGNPGPEWSRDGRSLILSDQSAPDESRLIQLNLQSGAVRELTRPEGRIHDFFPRVSPDGTRVAFARYFSHGLAEIFVMPLDTLRPLQLTAEKRTLGGVSWRPDGEKIVFSSDRQGAFQLWEIGASGGKPVRLPMGASSASDVAVAPSGDWLAYADNAVNTNIWRARLTPAGNTTPEMKSPERFIASSGRNHTPRYSPDGRSIVFVSDRSGSWEIWICDASGANARQLTHFQGPFLGGMTWSPDSKRIAFDARPSGHAAIFMQNVEGGEPRMLDNNRFEERVPSWSKDGKSIYFSSDRDGSSTIWKRSLSDNSLKKVGRKDTFLSSESPDGAVLYYQLMGGRIVRATPEGTDSQTLSPDVVAFPGPNWAVGRHGVYYTRADKSAGAFYLFSGSQPRLIGRTSRPLAIGTPSLSVSPDEQWILFARQDHSTSDIYVRRGKL